MRRCAVPFSSVHDHSAEERVTKTITPSGMVCFLCLLILTINPGHILTFCSLLRYLCVKAPALCVMVFINAALMSFTLTTADICLHFL